MSDMADTDLIIERANIANARLIEPLSPDIDLAPGQVMVAVDRFGLTSNNLSYAATGDLLGYWSFFPAPDPTWGRLPVWGYAHVTRSEHPEVAVGEQLFGILPAAARLVIEPTDVSAVSLCDSYEHRTALHPWYNRYYRTTADPVTTSGLEDLQPILWALFMTGWHLAGDFAANDNYGADHIVVSSASSRTAYSFAYSLKANQSGANVVGVTSQANAEFVSGLGCYDTVITYDDLGLESLAGTVAFVDMAGNTALRTSVHGTFGDRLVRSFLVGGTHRDATPGPAELPGPEPKFFFIPDAAEQQAAADGREQYHAKFAAAWVEFGRWASGHTSVVTSTGATALLDAYNNAIAGSSNPTVGTLISYS